MGRAAKRYAKAILNYALEQKKEAQVQDDMLIIATTIKESADLQMFLGSPVIKSDVKKAGLTEVFGSKISDLSVSLINLLVDNKRLAILEEVAKQYAVIYDTLKGIEVAEVTTAIPLTDALNKKVLAKVKELTGKQATLKNVVNSDILGGFILRIGDVQYDASIANKLQLLKRQFDTQV